MRDEAVRTSTEEKENLFEAKYWRKIGCVLIVNVRWDT